MSTTPLQCTPLAAASAAPTSPPIRAWEEEVGSPSRQVIRFQQMAPIRAANTTLRPWELVGVAMMPAPTVLAPPVPSAAPAKFMHAASASAAAGVSARVEIDVAIAFAASWKPLVKSNAKAMTTTAARAARFAFIEPDSVH